MLLKNPRIFVIKSPLPSSFVGCDVVPVLVCDDTKEPKNMISPMVVFSWEFSLKQ
jgi:hypothetical protein